MSLNHKEMAKHIRKRLKHHKVKASVRMLQACGVKYISISEPKYGAGLTEEGTQLAYHIGMVNGLTGARGSEIAPMIELAKQHKWNRAEVRLEFHGEAA